MKKSPKKQPTLSGGTAFKTAKRSHLEVVINDETRTRFLRCAKHLTGQPASKLMRSWIYEYLEKNMKKCIDID